MGYVSPSLKPDCPAIFTFHMNGREENTSTTRALDETHFRCRLKDTHTIHLADHDFPKLGKRITITWGNGAGKPRIIETALSSTISQSPAVDGYETQSG
jgi:hypothetical protein